MKYLIVIILFILFVGYENIDSLKDSLKHTKSWSLLERELSNK